MMAAIVQSPIVAAIAMGLPVYFLVLTLIAYNSQMYIYINYNTSPTILYTIFAFTAAGWFIEIVGIRLAMPNLLHFCAFAHAAIGSWWLVNFIIIFFAGWSYIPANLMPVLLIGLLSPALIWHVTGDIIRAYKRKLVTQIESYNRALAQQGEAFTAVDMTNIHVTGAPKV